MKCASPSNACALAERGDWILRKLEEFRELVAQRERNAIRWEAGEIVVPDAPGLGIEIDEELARAHPFTGTGLHLEMQEAPCSYGAPNRFAGGAPRD